MWTKQETTWYALSWRPLPREQINGILLGYKISYYMSYRAGIMQVRPSSYGFSMDSSRVTPNNNEMNSAQGLSLSSSLPEPFGLVSQVI